MCYDRRFNRIVGRDHRVVSLLRSGRSFVGSVASGVLGYFAVVAFTSGLLPTLEQYLRDLQLLLRYFQRVLR